jgi:class 3 adenylate cyclase/predicted ATPase
MDVTDWLRGLGLERYAVAFRENEISADLLPALTAQDLHDLGITAIGHRRRLLDAIAVLAGDEPARSAVEAAPSDRAAAERRHLTVLFCDLVGSTPLSTRLDPEDLREVLHTYRASVVAAVRGQHGYVAKYLGDGVLAYFGWPNADETHADSAVRAGLAAIEALRPHKLPVRVGIATGLVIVGDLIGAGVSQEHPAIGETPNLAARLQAMAQPDTIVVSEATRAQLGRMFEMEALGPLALKGFGKPVIAWRVRRETGITSRSEALYSGAVPPLIGRSEELDLLLRRWRQAKDGEGRVVLLSGEAGIGKSRLLAALEERLADEQHVGLRYFCSPHHQDSALYPLTARMEREACFARGDTAADRLAKLEAMLAPTAPAPDDVALLAALLSIPPGAGYPVLELSPQRRKERTFAALIGRLTSLARNAPVLLLFEDAHWSDPTSLELLDIVIEQIADLPVLLIASFRPDFSPPWFGRPGVSLIALSRLDRRDATELAVQIVTGHALSSGLLDRIVVQADGVPLFIEELTKAVLETAEPDATRALTVPNTLQASLMARLDRLPAAKQVAQIGSVIGREFPHILLAAVAHLPVPLLAEGLEELIALALVFRRGTPPEAMYAFKHALVRDVAYASLLKTSRQQLHAMIGDALRRELPERAEAEPEFVAYHYAEAGSTELAVEWWAKAGELGLQRSANVEAIGHFEKALALSQELGDAPEYRLGRSRLEISYGNALRVVRGFGAPETRAAFARARDLARVLSDVPERFSAEYGLWSASFIGGDLAAMRELANAFLQKIEDRPDLPENGIAHRLVGMTCWFAGEFISARPHLERALACYDAERDYPLAFRFGQDLAVPPMAYLAMTLWPLGSAHCARRFAAETVTHALQTKHVPTTAYAYLHASLFELMRRDRRKSDPYVRAYLRLAREHVMPMWLSNGAFHESWLRWRAGKDEADLAQMHRALKLIREQGQGVVTPLQGVLLAEAEAEASHYDDALATIHAQLAEMMHSGQRWFLAEGHRVHGELLRKSQPARSEAAEAAFMRAIEVARAQSARRFELRAAMSLARLWLEQGRQAEARDLLSPVYDWFTEGLGSVDLQEARAILAELDEPRPPR